MYRMITEGNSNETILRVLRTILLDYIVIIITNSRQNVLTSVFVYGLIKFLKFFIFLNVLFIPIKCLFFPIFRNRSESQCYNIYVY